MHLSPDLYDLENGLLGMAGDGRGWGAIITDRMENGGGHQTIKALAFV